MDRLLRMMVVSAFAAAGVSCFAAEPVPKAPPGPKNARLRASDGGQLVVAHRGGRCEFGDNAVGGFVWCLANGVRGFETDVRFSKDRELVIMHDDRIDRTTDGHGLVSDLTCEEIVKCRLKTKNGSETVPKAADLLEVFRGRDDVFVELEMKTTPGHLYPDPVLKEYCEKLHALATSVLLPGTYAFSSFDHRTLGMMHRLFPDAPLSLIVCHPTTEDDIRKAVELGCSDIAAMRAKTTKEMVERAHAAGLSVNLWHAQNADEFADARAKGADRSTSDFPVRVNTRRPGDYPYAAAELANVTVTGGFWLPRFETNRLVTLRSCFEKCELARIPNFSNAAARAWGTFRGIPFDDSDVYKVIEGAAYVLSTHPDPELEKYVDDLIAKIARAQEPDGYLYTARTLGFTYRDKKTGAPSFGMMGPTRWSNSPSSHELYNVGHLYEAAVAYRQATGKRTLLDVAIRSADLVDRVFGPGATQLKAVPGHEEIELALVKLYRETKEPRYLALAKHFIAQRGAANADRREAAVFAQSGDLVKGGEMAMSGAYCQNHMPVVRQREAVGHAVRAGYLYCGLADVAALSGDPFYVQANDRLWENVTGRKLHLSGGIGARRGGEAFGAAYELPNAEAYLETCAAIANALWNQRLFLTHGEAKYVDVLERVIYNGFLSGVSLRGDEYFYPNPLASRGGYARSKWFGCSCCPVNIVRFIPQIAPFAYATRGDEAHVNLFIESDATLSLASGMVKLSQKTDYPWAGLSRVTVTPPADGMRFTLNVRVPGWCVGRPVPGDLYTQVVPGCADDFILKVNGEKAGTVTEKGYCAVERVWKTGDVVEVVLNMPVRRIRAHASVTADRGRLAVERGPVLYCAEGVDNGDRVFDLAVAADAPFSVADCEILGNRYPALETSAARIRRNFGEATLSTQAERLRLVPYFAWCHRGAGEMQCWFPERAEDAEPASSYAVTSSFHDQNVLSIDRFSAVTDGVVPKTSGDTGVPRLTFWPHKGTEEWMALALPRTAPVSGVEVMWFDDTPRGGCKLPAAWRIESRDAAGVWRPVEAACPVQRDRMTSVRFANPVTSDAVRIVVLQQKGFSSGLLEARLLP